MDQPYFATYTGCDDLFLVCQRRLSNYKPYVLGHYPTMEAAKTNAAQRNVQDLIGILSNNAEDDLTDDTLLVLMETSNKLNDLLKWDMNGYRIERDRAAAAEALTAPGDTESEQVA